MMSELNQTLPRTVVLCVVIAAADDAHRSTDVDFFRSTVRELHTHRDLNGVSPIAFEYQAVDEEAEQDLHSRTGLTTNAASNLERYCCGEVLLEANDLGLKCSRSIKLYVMLSLCACQHLFEGVCVRLCVCIRV